MQLEAFQASLNQSAPPAGISPALQALWYARTGDWDRSHDITQPGGPAREWGHAYPRRAEGERANAADWYRRAGKPVSTIPVDEEWAELVTVFLREENGE